MSEWYTVWIGYTGGCAGIVQTKELESAGRGSKTSVWDFQSSGNGRKWVKPSEREQGIGGVWMRRRQGLVPDVVELANWFL